MSQNYLQQKSIAIHSQVIQNWQLFLIGFLLYISHIFSAFDLDEINREFY